MSVGSGDVSKKLWGVIARISVSEQYRDQVIILSINTNIEVKSPFPEGRLLSLYSTSFRLFLIKLNYMTYTLRTYYVVAL